MRKCYECKIETPKSRCPECAAKHNARNKKNREENKESYQVREYQYGIKQRAEQPEMVSAYKRKHKIQQYGITVDEYLSMHERQGGVCALCFGDNDGENLYIDHDHDGGVVRGLLCRACNSALGFFRDNPETMARAIIYVQKDKG